MKSRAFLATLSVFALSSNLLAKESQNFLHCTGGINASGNTKVEAKIYPSKKAAVTFAFKAYDSNEISYDTQVLKFDKNDKSYYKEVGYCSDQVNGGQTYVLKTLDNTAVLEVFWCDDDGGSGQDTFQLTCSTK